MAKLSTMAEGRKRLEEQKIVSDWLLDNYEKLTRPDLFERINGDFIPFNLMEFLSDIKDSNLRDAVTLMISHAIRDAQEGILPDDSNN